MHWHYDKKTKSHKSGRWTIFENRDGTADLWDNKFLVGSGEESVYEAKRLARHFAIKISN